MSPSYIFRIDEITEARDAISHMDNKGYWVPSTDKDANVRVSGGVSGKLWYCDTQRIFEIDKLPTGSYPFKTFSAYYSGGRGIFCLRGDATNPGWEGWHPLRFDYNHNDYSSFLTNAGMEDTLYIQRDDQEWPQILLPTIYHTSRQTTELAYGGLTGELPIFLALQALAFSKDWLPAVIPTLFTDGAWVPRTTGLYRTHQRGVVVYVYTAPTSWAGGSTHLDLEQYERGLYGKYFD